MKLETSTAGGPPIKITMTKPCDMHQHLRDGSILKLVAPMVAKRFDSAIVMPNLVPPITTIEAVDAYRGRILNAMGNSHFHPMMTFYLTDSLDPTEVGKALDELDIFAIKYYPHGLTTNSDSGVKNPADLWTPGTKPYECLQTLAAHEGILLLHAADGIGKDGFELDPYDQERHFIERSLPEIRRAHPTLKISVEHLSTRWGVDYILENGCDRLGCSLTAHHLLLDRRDVFRGGFNTHRAWMPVIQPKEHKEAIRALAQADKSFVWLGSDSAPHPRQKKEAACCASGVLMAHAGIELYAEAFEKMDALDDRFERFASFNGPAFFNIPPSRESISLVREEWKPEPMFFAEESKDDSASQVVPFRFGEAISWKLVD